jgi:hypothetical protein
MSEWKPISEATVGRAMFVVRAFNVSLGGRPYTSDPYCVWQDTPGVFVRWPHHFAPTHWMPLPQPPKETE